MNILISVETFESIAASVLEAIRPITEWSYQGTPQYYADDISFFAYDSRLDDAELSTEADSLAIYFDTAGVKESVVDRIYSAIVDEFSRRGIRLTRSGDIDGGSQGLVYDVSLMAARKVPKTVGEFVSWVQADYRLPDKPARREKGGRTDESKRNNRVAMDKRGAAGISLHAPAHGVYRFGLCPGEASRYFRLKRK